MLAKGNSNKHVCVSNLLKIVRGEVCYDRVRGIDASLIDSPVSAAKQRLKADAEWLIRTYEPRATLKNISLGMTDSGTVKIETEIL